MPVDICKKHYISWVNSQSFLDNNLYCMKWYDISIVILRILEEFKVVNNDSDAYYSLNQNLVDMYKQLYLNNGIYKETVRGIGFKALYYFKESDWEKNLDELEFLSMFKRCISHDFKTYSGTKTLIDIYTTNLNIEEKKSIYIKDDNLIIGTCEELVK